MQVTKTKSYYEQTLQKEFYQKNVNNNFLTKTFSEMENILITYYNKLFFKKWIIGICHENISDIIRKKKFNPNIKWLRTDSPDKFYADPFLIPSKNGGLNIMYEEFPFNENYGKISLMALDEKFNPKSNKLLLDTKSHLSYPFIYAENNKTYIFPESAQNGKLSCYEYDSESESIKFLKDILDLPLRDSTIIKHDNKYWIVGTLSEAAIDYKLHIFVSDNLLGPYIPHPKNPVKNGLNGTRSAGNFIEINGTIYRPTQNCQKNYGESITINKVTELSLENFSEEPHMTIKINKKNKNNRDVRSIHTINVLGNNIVVDGEQWIFSPKEQWKSFLKSRIKRIF